MGTKFNDYLAEKTATATAHQRALDAAFDAYFDTEELLHFTIPRALIASRKAAGLNQQQLADLTGINQSEISRIETGLANPTVETVQRLTSALDVHLAIVDGSGRPIGLA